MWYTSLLSCGRDKVVPSGPDEPTSQIEYCGKAFDSAIFSLLQAENHSFNIQDVAMSEFGQRVAVV